MPIRNWGGGGDPSDTFLALQDQFLREAQAARDRALAAAQAASGGGGRGGGGGRRRSGGRTTSQSVRENVASITERMAKGQTNWKELYQYYRNAHENAPTGSALKRELAQNLENVEYVLELNGIPIPDPAMPTIAGPEGAGPAWGVLTEDDLLTPEVEEILNEQIMYLTTTENGVFPVGQNPIESLVGRMLADATVDELRDGLIADAKLQEMGLDAFINSTTGSLVFDPVSRTNVEVTPDLIMERVNQAMNTQYTLLGVERGLGAEGDFAGRMGHLTGVMKKADRIFSEVIFPATNPDGTLSQPNIKGIDGYLDLHFRHFNKARNLALESMDPFEAQQLMGDASRELKKSLQDTLKLLDSLPGDLGADEDTRAHIDYAIKLADFGQAATSNRLDEETLAEMADDLLINRPSSFYLTEADISATIGSRSDNIGEDNIPGLDRDSPGWHGLMGAADVVSGLNTAEAVRTGQEGQPIIDGERYVWVTRYGETVPTPVKESMVADWLGLEGDFKESAFPFVEKIKTASGTKNTLVWRQMAPLSEIQDTNWWAKLDTSGQVMTDRSGNIIWASQEEAASFGNSPARARQEGYTSMPMEALAGMMVVIGADGNRYYTTEERTGLHVNMPLSTEVEGGFAPHALVNDKGVMDLLYKPVQGTPVGQGPSVSDKEAQEFMEEALISGELPEGLYHKVDPATGIVSMEPASFVDGDYANTLWTHNQQLGYSHQQTRLNYHKNAEPRMKQAQRERAIRKAEEARMAEQMLAEQNRPNGAFGARALQDNAIEAAMQSTGVKFGVAREQVDPSHNRKWTAPEKPVAPQLRDTPPPISMDDMKGPEVPQYKTTGRSGGARPI